MFTGIIQATGNIVSLTRGHGAARLVVSGPEDFLAVLREGDSIAVNGVCLTAIEPGAGRFSADLAQETLRITALGDLAPHALVNLELPTPEGSPLGGHIVLGHVEGVGRIVSLEPTETDTARPDWRLRVWLPRGVDAHVVPKGSIAIDGISLTIAALKDAEDEGLRTGTVVEVAIIPHTYEATRLHALTTGDSVNVETDVLLRQASRARTAAENFEVTLEYLVAQGY